MTKTTRICIVWAGFLAFALPAVYGDGPQSNAVVGGAVSSARNGLSNVTKTTVSVSASANNSKLLDLSDESKIAVSEAKKTKSLKSQKKAKSEKHSDEEPKSDPSAWTSWLWTDSPTAPSVRKCRPGDMPRFK